MKNSLKNKLKNQYENQSEIPTENLWERIESQLENSEEKKVVVAKKINYWKYAAIFLMVVSLGLVVNYFLNQKSVNPEFVNTEEPNLKQNENSIPIEEIENIQPIQINNSQEIAINKTSNSTVNSSDKTAVKVNDEKTLTQNNQKSIVENVIKPEKEDSPKVIVPNIENKPVLAQQPIVKEKTKYITANELLFGREVDKSYKEQQENDEGKMGVNLRKPKEVKILGITVYSDEQ